MAETNRARADLAQWIGTWLGGELGVKPADVDPEKPLVGYGMDSIHAMMLVGDLEERLGRRLSPTLTWDHPTVNALSRHLAPDPATGGEPIDGVDGGVAVPPDQVPVGGADRRLDAPASAPR